MSKLPGRNKPIIAIDFDGVIHSYGRGWDDGSIYGHVVPGFWEWAYKAQEIFTLVIVSSRLSVPSQAIEMNRWLSKHHQEWCTAKNLLQPPPDLEMSWTRPPALVTIDDRGVRFAGDWTAPWLQPDAIKLFKPWHMVRSR